jgi:hypothetical protein
LDKVWVKVRSGKGMANPICLVSPKAEEKKSNMERKRTQKEEVNIRQFINFFPFHKFEGITSKKITQNT